MSSTVYHPSCFTPFLFPSFKYSAVLAFPCVIFLLECDCGLTSELNYCTCNVQRTFVDRLLLANHMPSSVFVQAALKEFLTLLRRYVHIIVFLLLLSARLPVVQYIVFLFNYFLGYCTLYSWMLFCSFSWYWLRYWNDCAIIMYKKVKFSHTRTKDNDIKWCVVRLCDKVRRQCR